jgi:hypothetical protein
MLMKALWMGALVSALAATAHAEGSPDSWAAPSRFRPDTRFFLGDVPDSFAARSHVSNSWLGSGDLHGWSEEDGDRQGRHDGGGDFPGSSGDDRHEKSGLDDDPGCCVLTAVPEPSTWAMFTLGVALLGYTTKRLARRR